MKVAAIVAVALLTLAQASFAQHSSGLGKLFQMVTNTTQRPGATEGQRHQRGEAYGLKHPPEGDVRQRGALAHQPAGSEDPAHVGPLPGRDTGLHQEFDRDPIKLTFPPPNTT